MKAESKKRLGVTIAFLTAFIVWTVLVQFVDRANIGPKNSSVGLATINGYLRNLVGVCMPLYTVTDWLGLVPIAASCGFAVLGLIQWIKRKRLKKVDYSLFVLGGFYIVVFTAYLLFEYLVINYRPVLINGYLESSYPSSTTLLVLTIMPTAIMQLNRRIKNKAIRCTLTIVITLFILFMVVGRFVSGVHWFSDIVGGILLSAGLVSAYAFVVSIKKEV